MAGFGLVIVPAIRVTGPITDFMVAWWTNWRFITARFPIQKYGISALNKTIMNNYRRRQLTTRGPLTEV